jgi:hypothetical protein
MQTDTGNIYMNRKGMQTLLNETFINIYEEVFTSLNLHI